MIFGVIARTRAKAYWRGVSFRRCVTILLTLALFLGPAIMPRAAMAESGHQASLVAAPHHCAEKQEPIEKKAPDNCCVMACSAIAAAGAAISLPRPAHEALPPLPVAPTHEGLHADAPTPPPRFS